MISDDGSKKWRWQINTQTVLSFTKSGGQVYADLEFATPNGDVENKVTTPGSGDQDTIAGATPSSACSTRSMSSLKSPTPPSRSSSPRAARGGVPPSAFHAAVAP